MKAVTLDVRALEDSMAEFVQAWKAGKASKSDRISFASPELLWNMLTARRWELLKAMCAPGCVAGAVGPRGSQAGFHRGPTATRSSAGS